MSAAWKFAVVLPFLILLGCAGYRNQAGFSGAPGPEVAIDRFLQHAARGEYAAMGALFGTAAGSILERDPPAQVEQRMYALASLLGHDGFGIGAGSPVPGRGGGAVHYEVVLHRRGEALRLPLIVVRGPHDRWFIEQLVLEAITAR